MGFLRWPDFKFVLYPIVWFSVVNILYQFMNENYLFGLVLAGILGVMHGCYTSARRF